jgi:hypothetical protein
MLDFFICMIISIMIGCGMSITLVEKGKDFPVRKYRVILQKIIRRYVGKKWGKVFKCSACTSFWATGISDTLICIIAACHGVFYFLWPFSGFVALGIVFIIIEVLNSMEKQQNINLVIGDNSDKGE